MGHTDVEKQILLQLARKTIDLVTSGKPMPKINLPDYPPALQESGASFVTLTRHGQLRGCIGALEATMPLVMDVCEHSEAAALHDYRFLPVSNHEVGDLQIEISILTKPVQFDYKTVHELLNGLRPGIDGVILKHGYQRATFLPQVWEKIPDNSQFLSQLCQKMGAPADLWKKQLITVLLYQVEEFSE